MESKVHEMIQQARCASRLKDWRFKSENSALLVLDMQSYFLDASSHAFVPSAMAIIPGIQSLVRMYNASNRPVILTRHINSHSETGMMARWWSELITEDNPLSVIHPDLIDSQTVVIEKSFYDAFYHTYLEDVLRDKKIERIVICGVMTHLCCDTTARSAFMRGFEVFFTADGTATYNEQFHRAALLNLAHGFATLVTVKQIIAELSEEPDD
ncbi:MAG: isochorismatase hydrolase [Deltaproteobacteria bacterium]|nr:isochorismatase hydrolase [Deltaproteobacteria bacterium]